MSSVNPTLPFRNTFLFQDVRVSDLVTVKGARYLTDSLNDFKVSTPMYLALHLCFVIPLSTCLSAYRNQAITLVSENAYASLGEYSGGMEQSTVSIVDVETKSASGVCPVKVVSASFGPVSMGFCSCTSPFSLNVSLSSFNMIVACPCPCPARLPFPFLWT